MAINVGAKYQHLLHRSGCNCLPNDANIFPNPPIVDRSRRQFLATVAGGSLALVADAPATAAQADAGAPRRCQPR